MNDDELWIASQKYIMGEISGEELKTVEKRHEHALKHAILTISAREVREQWRKKCPITRVLRWRKRNAI